MDSDSYTTYIILYIALILIFIIFSAMVSASEVSFFSIKKNDLDDMKNKKIRDKISKLLSIPEKLLSTILISNNFINIFIVIISSYLINYMNFIDGDFKVLIQILIITPIIILFGEIIPKIYASRNYIKFSLFIFRFIKILDLILKPINNFLYYINGKLLKENKKNNLIINENELNEAIEIASNEDLEEEKNILKSIMSLSKNEAKQIMTPRVDILSIEKNDPFDKVLKIIINNKYSRIPIYKGNLDKICGILYSKDLIKYLNETKDFNWNKFIRKSFFIPENKKINNLLNQFREKKIHMAIVVDEYGVTSGIITLDDIMEEIVGDISDEFEEKEEILYTKIDEKNYIFKSKISMNDFIKIINLENLDLENINSETLAGFILEKSEEIPKKNEEILINKNLLFRIENVDSKKINKIKLTILDNEKE